MERRSILLLGSLAAAVALLVLSRTQRGQVVAADALELVSVTARRIRDAALPRGLRNNNPGNLRFIGRNPWDGQVGDDGAGYGVYSSMEKGVRAAGRQLLAYQRRGLRSVRQIISTWAPATENDTAAYVKAVSRSLNVAADQRIDVDILLDDLATAIFKHELGAVAFAASLELTRDNIRKWVRS